MRRLGTLLLASTLVLAACGDDDRPSTEDDRGSANQSITAFEAAARDAGFEVDADEDDDDSELEFRSEECRQLDALLSDDGDTEGETADIDSDDFVRSDGQFEETLAASVVVADAEALAEDLAAFDDERTAPCIEEAFTLLFEELADEQDDVEVEARDVAVELEHPELGDDAVRLQATGVLGVDVLEIPFAFEILFVQAGRRGVTVTYSAFGVEPQVEVESFIDVLLEPPASA